MIPGFWTFDFWTPKGVGDLLEVVGILVAIFGFIKAIRAANRATSAADQAKIAANNARDRINFFESIVGFSTGIANLKDIQRLHDQMPTQAPLLLDRYRSTRELLVVIGHSNLDMTEAQRAIVQAALSNMVDMEKQLQSSPSSFKAARRNAIVSTDIDGLVTVLTQLKSQASGVR